MKKNKFLVWFLMFAGASAYAQETVQIWGDRPVSAKNRKDTEWTHHFISWLEETMKVQLHPK